MIGVIVAFLAFGRDLFGIEMAPDAAQAPTAGATTAPAPVTPSPRTPGPPSSPATLPETPSGKPLIDLTPVAGGRFLERVPDTTTFTIACATNSDGDMYRAVQFTIPRRDAATLGGQVGPTEITDDVGVDVRVDSLIRARVLLRPGQSPSAFAATVAGGSTLELRLTCARPGGAVTFSHSVLTK